MKKIYTVSLKEIIDEFNMETIYLPKNAQEIKIVSADLNRLGLQLVGFFDFFDSSRIQILGKVEYTYLKTIDKQNRTIIFDKLFSKKFPAIFVTRELKIFDEMLVAAQKYEVPIIRTNEPSSTFMSSLISWLNARLAIRITRHGVLVEVYGEGVLLFGDSGVGKSETAMELLKRGHRLIADDAVEIKRVSNRTLVGTSPDVIRHFIELRGIGIIDVRRIFGMGAVKESEKINLVIELEYWDETKTYERLGLESQTIDILGLKIPCLRIPIKPGRNLAIIIEVAAMNNRQKRFGYNAAEELNKRITKDLENARNT